MTKLAVHIVLDRSGSMSSIKDDAIGGVNDYVKGLDPDTKVWLTLFDSQSIDTVLHGTRAADVRPITFEPRGMTPLYDAIGRSVPALAAAQAEQRALVIVTDGLENNSLEYTREGIRDLLKEKQEKDNWLVVYLGANQDAFAEGAKIGTVSHNTLNYNPKKLRSAFSASANATMRFASAGNREDAAYTVQERQSTE